MSYTKTPFWIFLLSAILISGNALICPDQVQITPCSCADDEISCVGMNVTQEVIGETVHIIREYNSLGSSDFLQLNSILISETQLTHIDLTPFLNTTSNSFYISDNVNLVSISQPGLGHEGSIHVRDVLSMGWNSLTDEGLGSSLRYFAPTLYALELHGNKLKGSLEANENLRRVKSANFEFLPGLSSFTQLTHLNIGTNEITVLRGGQFATHNRLTRLNLGLNKLKIEADAFAFNESPLVGTPLEINLHQCDLNDYVMNNTVNGLIDFGRPLDLKIWNNQFQYLSQENFEPLLKAHDLTVLWMFGNPLICDDRMKWLKDQKIIFEPRVYKANCTNDPGFDVFSTNLIS